MLAPRDAATATTFFSLGSFSDTTANANSWLVDINWGDSTAHTTFTTASPGTLANQTHTYGEEGSYTVTETITDFTNQSTARTFTVNVSDPPVVAAPVASLNGVEGASLTNSLVATFTDPGGAESNSDYSATIEWGDGVTDSGIIGNSGGHFGVAGTHIYSEQGTYGIKVTIHHESAPDAVNGQLKAVAGRRLRRSSVEDEPRGCPPPWR